jgi:hypothetical protein
MTIEPNALEFLSQLERAEWSVLSWGLIDGFFSEEELENRADEFLGRLNEKAIAHPFDSAWTLLESLLEENLLWRLPDSNRYRTRMAETVRLCAQLRQIFADQQYATWRTAPSLVADYRLVVRPRLFPIRDVSPTAVVEGLRRQTSLSEFQASIINSFLRHGTEGERLLARFQVRSTERILRMVGRNRSFGTVVCAGTGSGKTLAFYLPAYVRMASRVSPEHWTKCLAIYPRNELLKDQFREALANARRIVPILVANGKRKLVIAALYGDVPSTASKVLNSEGPGTWARVRIAGGAAYECPFVRCPNCGQNMAWLETDIQREFERLYCTDQECNERVEPDEIRLTRKRMLADPPDLLFTSTEMLNQRMSSARYGRLFGIGVRADRRPEFVLIDEAHAYEGVHGAHVALLLRRWRRAAEANPHYVGLSATLADAPRFFAELVGIGPGDVGEIWPETEELQGEGAEYMLAVRGDPSSGTSLLSTTIQALMLMRRVLGPESNDYTGSRVFSFSDNLDVINRLYHNLLDAEGWDAFGRPNPTRPLGSLANLRSTTLPNARERFNVGQNWALVEEIGHVLAPGSRVRVGRTSSQDAGVDAGADIIVATASLEVGFDDPDVGVVLQHKAPQSTAAFLQRKGRAGRKQSMRPWTVVVLSDYGRDRIAYQSYDQLFSPRLPARQLALRNRAVLRMQATYTLFDWLARRLPQNERPDPWLDFSQPPQEVQNAGASVDLGRRQLLYAEYLRGLLEHDSIREEFSYFLRRSLAIEEEEVTAILWESPRSLMTEAVPTLLRRLERGWRRIDGMGLEQHLFRVPLPEFVPRTLFSDLQLPEVSIRIPAQGRMAARVESMPIAQALREFAPGRVSRRFGVSTGRERHWISPGNGQAVPVDSFCPVSDRQDLGRFRYIGRNGIGHEIPVFRPHAIDVALTPVPVQQSSNSFLDWHTEIVPTSEGSRLDIPDGHRWLTVIRSCYIHSHHLGSPAEIRRFAVGATASVGWGPGQQVTQSLHFVSTTEGDANTPVAVGVGFAGDHDAIQIRFRYPANLRELCGLNGPLVRGLRVARFRWLVQTAPTLDGIANHFQRQWLAQAYLSAIIATALRESVSLRDAEATVSLGTSTTTVRGVLETILQWSAGDFDVEDQSDEDAIPRRLGELRDLFGLAEVRAALHEFARALWEGISEDWDDWLRIRFKATLGAALLDAAVALAPQIGGASLMLDLQARVDNLNGDRSSTDSNEDEIWLTESIVGGGGFVEDFLNQYVRDPRRYFRLLDAALAASDLEVVSEEVSTVLEVVTSEGSGAPALVAAFGAVRAADSHAATVAALNRLRAELSLNRIQPTPTLLIALATRVLRPGTNADTDGFLSRSQRDWDAAEHRLGIDVDARVFALVKSWDPELERVLRLENVVVPGSSTASWRYGVLYGMFWPRGAQIRNESLRAWNPFGELPECDRLLVLSAVPRTTQRVNLSGALWFQELARLLVQYGAVELACRYTEPDRLADALLRIGTEPVDSEAILVHARLSAISHDNEWIVAEIELPEVFQ